MKNIYIFALLCFSIDGYSLSKEYICTYKGTFQSNPYDKKTYVETNPKLLDFKQKIIINFKSKLVTREYINIGWDGEKKIKIKQKKLRLFQKPAET